MKKQLYNWGIFLLLLLLLSPLFKLHVTGLHAWGGDFSQYIHEAINIVDNKPVGDIGYIYNENHPSLAPSAYPVGFPILLAPVYAKYGNDMMVFMTFMALLLFLLGGVCFYFIKFEFGALAAFLGTIVLIYNPWTIGFKAHILSDIPFTLFLLLSAFVYLHWENKRVPVIIGLIVGFTILIRTVGIVIPIAIALDKSMKILLAYRSKNNELATLKKEAIEGLTIIVTALVVVFLIHNVILPLPEDNNYSDIISSASKFDYLSRNFDHYIDLTHAYFTVNDQSWLSVISYWVFGLLALVGMVTQKQNTVFLLLLILGLFGIILLFPYLQQFRYVFPIVPFLIYYFIAGSKKVFANPKSNQIFLSIFLLFTLFFYIPKIIKFQKKLDDYPLASGPQQTVAIEAFQYVKENVPEDAIMVFSKPRVLSLYADRKCMRNSYSSADVVHGEFLDKNIDYILVNKWLGNRESSIGQYLEKYQESHLDSLWSNSRYVLFQFKKDIN